MSAEAILGVIAIVIGLIDLTLTIGIILGEIKGRLSER